jgi:transcriptional regulator with XRE-family HTH domain
MQAIKLVRLLRGKSQWDVTAETGIRNYRISLLENGKAVALPQEIRKLAMCYDIPCCVLRSPLNVESIIERITADAPAL